MLLDHIVLKYLDDTPIYSHSGLASWPITKIVCLAGKIQTIYQRIEKLFAFWKSCIFKACYWYERYTHRVGKAWYHTKMAATNHVKWNTIVLGRANYNC